MWSRWNKRKYKYRIEDPVWVYNNETVLNVLCVVVGAGLGVACGLGYLWVVAMMSGG